MTWYDACCFCFSVPKLCPILCDSWTAAGQSFLAFTISQSLLKLMSTELMTPFNHHILYHPCPQSFPALGFFPMSWLFASGCQSSGASASTSLLPMNAQGWFPLKVKVKSLSHVRLFATLWTVAHQVPPSVGFSRQDYWSGLQFPSPGDLSNPGIEPRSPTLQADTLTSEPPEKLGLTFHLLALQGNLKSLHQHHSSKASVPPSSAFLMVQLSHPHMLLLLLSRFSRVWLCTTP